MVQLPDAELIELVKNGDDIAFEHLLSRYKPLIKRLIRNYFIRNYDDDDFYQIGVLAFYQAILTFEAKQGSSFYAFALSCVRNKVISVWRKNREEIEYITDHQDFLVVMQPRGQYDCDSEVLTIMNEEKLFDQRKRFERLLNDEELFSDLEREILEGYLNGWKRKEIARAKGMDVHKVSRTLYRIKAKMKEEGLRT